MQIKECEVMTEKERWLENLLAKLRKEENAQAK
jgi:hypothetical protein